MKLSELINDVLLGRWANKPSPIIRDGDKTFIRFDQLQIRIGPGSTLTSVEYLWGNDTVSSQPFDPCTLQDGVIIHLTPGAEGRIELQLEDK